MKYSYRGKDYSLNLAPTGKIVCTELGIEEDTADAVQIAIRKLVDEEKNVPSVAILTFGDGYSRSYAAYYEGKAKPINVGEARWPQVWMSWKDGTQNKRAKVSPGYVYLNTPANRVAMETIIDLSKQIDALEAERERIKEGLETLKLPRKENP